MSSLTCLWPYYKCYSRTSERNLQFEISSFYLGILSSLPFCDTSNSKSLKISSAEKLTCSNEDQQPSETEPGYKNSKSSWLKIYWGIFVLRQMISFSSFSEDSFLQLSKNTSLVDLSIFPNCTSDSEFIHKPTYFGSLHSESYLWLV